MLITKSVIAIVSNKFCKNCSIGESAGEEPPDHVYPRNYDTSSKVMEADAALHLYKVFF